MSKGDVCSIDKCEKLVKSGNICQAHNWRMKVYGTYEKPSRRKYGDKCKVEGCENIRDLKQRSSLCTKHRVRMSRHKNIELPEKNKNIPEGFAKICIHHGPIKKKDTYKVPGTEWLNCKICRILRSEKLRDSRPSGFKKNRNYIFVGKKGNYIKVQIIQYEKMLAEQNGLCAICKKPETMVSPHCREKTKKLAIDHNHTTKKIRGLLCHRCNTGIGSFYESTELLQSAIIYLKTHQ